MEEGSAVESSASENGDIIPNVNYAHSTDGKFRSKQDEKEDDISDLILTD